MLFYDFVLVAINVAFYAFDVLLYVFSCSSKDILMRVVAQNLSPELTLVEKVCYGHLSFCFILLLFHQHLDQYVYI